MIPAGPPAPLQRGAGSVRRREMMEVAYDKRRGDEIQPLKGNYFCSCLKGSLLTFFFISVFPPRLKTIFRWCRAPRNKWDFSFSLLLLTSFII